MRFKREGYGSALGVDLVVGIDDSTYYGVERCGVLANYAHVATHYLNIREISGEGTVSIGNEAFGTDTYVYFLICNAGYGENVLAVDVELLANY